MDNLDGLRLLGYTLKKHRLGHVIAQSPQGSITIYSPDGEVLTSGVKQMEYVDEYLKVSTNDRYQVFNLYNNIKVIDELKNKARAITIRDGIVGIISGANTKMFNDRGKQIGTDVTPSRLIRSLAYNEETDSIVYQYDAYVYVNNQKMARVIGSHSFSSHYFMQQEEERVYQDGLHIPVYDIRSTKDGRVLSDICITDFQFIRDIAVVKDIDNNYYIVQGDKLRKIEIEGINDIEFAHDNRRDIHLILRDERYSYLYNLEIDKVCAKYDSIDTTIVNKMLVVKNDYVSFCRPSAKPKMEDNTCMLIDIHGREILKHPVYSLKLLDYYIEIKRDKDSEVATIGYDEIDNINK